MLWLIPIVIGSCIVLQGGWNRQLTPHLGLLGVALMTTFVSFALAVVIWALLQLNPERSPEILRLGSNPGQAWTWRAFCRGSVAC